MVIAVIADQIGDGCAGNGSGKEICRVRCEISRIKTAPGMAHDADVLWIDDAHLHDAFCGGGDAINHRDAGVAGFENDVRLENEIALAVDGADVVIGALRGRVVAVQVVGELFVHVNDHRVFFGGSVTGGIEERALQPFVVAVFVFDEFLAAPGVTVLERIGVGDRFRAF